MSAQNLPTAAAEYARAQRLEQQAALSAIRRQWARMGEEFDLSWSRVGPVVAAILMEAQQRVIDSTQEYIPSVLDETGQRDLQVATPDLDQLVGYTGAGELVGYATALAPIRAKEAVSAGATPFQALQKAGSWLTSASGLLLSDTGRAAESLSMYSRDGGGGFIRMLTPPSCGRCVVLAGRWYRYNQGFSRHPPTCDCRHIPASESMAEDLTVDSDAYFHSLDGAGQIKLAGSKANAEAIHDGADLAQIVNAYRKTAGMRFAQESPIKIRNGNKFTTEGTTRRARAAQQQVALRRNGPPQQRLMPESIARIAKSPEDRLRLLKLNGWIKDEAAISRGRAIFAEERRVAKNARARERRAAAKSDTDPSRVPGTSATNAPRVPGTAAGGAGRKPPTGPPRGRAADAPGPEDWAARQAALGIDTGGEVLEPHEIEFVEKFKALGHDLRWIPRDTTHTPRLPTNDFVWLDNNMLVSELKSTSAKYARVRFHIRRSVDQANARGVVKENFIVDIGARPLTPTLRRQLEQYNQRQSEHSISRLWVMSHGRLVEIDLA